MEEREPPPEPEKEANSVEHTAESEAEDEIPPVVPKKVIILPKLGKVPKSPRARGRGRGFGGPQRPQRIPKITSSTIIPPHSIPESNQPEDTAEESKTPKDEPIPLQKTEIPADIPPITTNPHSSDDEEMVQMMESEEYANKQLELMAIQLAKDKKRKEYEIQQQQQKIIIPLQPVLPPAVENPIPFTEQVEPPQPKKRGRRKKFVEGTSPLKQQLQAKIVPPIIIQKALITPPPVLNETDQEKPIIPQENIQVPSVVQDLSGSPPKRRGRGKGKKTLAAEAAAAGGPPPEGGDSQTSIHNTENTNISTGSGDSNQATSSPDPNLQTGKLTVATPPQPFSQSQPAPSVITRMLQSQPFTTAANAMNQKYFGSLDQPRGPPAFTNVTPRGRVPSPYRQNMPTGPFPQRPGLNPGSPHRLRSPGPQNMQVFHSPHHPLDPSPSGGGHMMGNAPNRDRQSPLDSKGTPTPPPQYNRPMTRFPGSGESARQHLPFQAGIRSSSPTRALGGSFSPFSPPPGANYHYGSYPPPALAAAEDAQPPTVYQNTSYPEPFNNPVESVVTQSSEGSNSKPFDEEGSGEFGGLVSYFSSQREDDLDT